MSTFSHNCRAGSTGTREGRGGRRKRGLRSGKDRIRQDGVAKIAMDEQDGGQAATLDLRRDMSRDGFRRGDAQLGVVVCGNVAKINMVEGLSWKQAGLAVRAGFVPV